MSMNLFIGIAIAAIVAVGGGYVAYTAIQSQSEVEVKTESTNENTQEADAEGSIQGTFAALLGLGQNLRCEFAFNDGTNVSNGVFYIAQGGERIRGDFNVVASAGGSMEGHLIRNDGYNYMWSSSMEQGIKMEIAPGEEGELFGDDNSTVPIDENTTYNCVPWAVQGSTFAVPTDIEFMDLGARLESMSNIEVNGTFDASGLKAQQCSSCDQIPDASAKAQCRAALSCE